MDIYITEIETGIRSAFAMLPDSIKCQCKTKFQSYQLLKWGEVKLPFGENLTGFSWSGTLPGELRKGISFIKWEHWKNPKELQSQWSIWRTRGTKLRLMVTGTPINHDVFLENYSVTYAGGHGDYKYNISFVMARDIKIYTMNELSKAVPEPKETEAPRPEPPKQSTYVVKAGDSLWKIAQAKLGNGARYEEIFELNKDKISNPNLIYPGQEFTLP